MMICLGLGRVCVSTALAASIALAGMQGLPGRAQAQDLQGSTEAAATVDGLFRGGVALVYGSNTVTEDTRRGLAMLEDAAAGGSVDALVELGSLYLYGTVLPKDWAKAKGYFDKAAKRGNWSGLAQHGMMLMWTERDWKTGQTLLEQAGAQGETSAWVILAEGAMYGYLGGGGFSRAKFAGYAEKARAAGEPKIAVLEAARYQWGISVRADGARAIAVLQAAADAGNGEAALALVNLLRDGNGVNISRNRASAKASMRVYAGLFDLRRNWQLDMALEAAEADNPAAFAALAAKVLSSGDLVTRDFGALLMKANANAAIYVLQAKLQAAGHDVGVLDGFATARTLAAMYDACMISAPPASCNDSVMREDVIGALFMWR